MKSDSRFVTPAGGILALLCFFMPWVKFSCKDFSKTITYTISGFELATKQQVNLITVALIAAVVMIVISLYMLKEQTPWKSKVPILISSGIGLGGLLFEYVRSNTSIDTGFGKISLEDLGITFQFGAFGTIIGFILAIVGVWNYSKPIDSSESHDEQEDKAKLSVENDEISTPSDVVYAYIKEKLKSSEDKGSPNKSGNSSELHDEQENEEDP